MGLPGDLKKTRLPKENSVGNPCMIAGESTDYALKTTVVKYIFLGWFRFTALPLGYLPGPEITVFLMEFDFTFLFESIMIIITISTRPHLTRTVRIPVCSNRGGLAPEQQVSLLQHSRNFLDLRRNPGELLLAGGGGGDRGFH